MIWHRTKKEKTNSVAAQRGIADFTWEKFRFRPDETQLKILESTSKRGILNCTRQWGKSTVTAVKAVHRAMTIPGSLVLVATPSGRQSGEFLCKASKLMRNAGIRPRGDGYNEMSLQFTNGSRIVGLPRMEGTVRGFSEVSLMLIDEASRMDDETYHALRPMLAVGRGDLWVMSTPFRKKGFFFETWEYGGPEWFRVRAPATECARIDPAFLDEERAELGEDKFRREYLCEFMDSGSDVFDRDLLARALDDQVHQVRVYV